MRRCAAPYGTASGVVRSAVLYRSAPYPVLKNLETHRLVHVQQFWHVDNIFNNCFERLSCSALKHDILNADFTQDSV